ncbi:MAG: transposase [Cyanobacteria bacterium P01_G01_bin.39]
MRFIRDLTPETIRLLKQICRESKYYQVRNRAECLILSYQGLSIRQLMKIFDVSRKTIYNWFTKWEDEKLVGLYNNQGKSRTSKRVNVIGLMNRRNELYYQIIKHSIESKDVIKFLDNFSHKIERKTVVVLDQASIHTSDSFIGKLEEWRQKKLEIFWLPTYSPKLNLIEILWKFIKYEWIDIDAYSSQKNLVKYLEKVLNNFGDEYVINFV